MKLNPEVKKKWVEALRSKKYAQGVGILRSTSDKFCCLGVLCDIFKLENPGHDWVREEDGFNFRGGIFCPNPPVLGWANLDEDAVTNLVRLNDSYISFANIADYIEKNL